MGLSLAAVAAFLKSHLGTEVSQLTAVGAGAWSSCFAFEYQAQELVIRFGQYPDDFAKDQRAYSYSSADLPVPEVLDIGEALAAYFAISTRVHGQALEQLSAGAWLETVPSLVSVMEALRMADISDTVGFGGWLADGKGAYASWSDYLLAVSRDVPQQRTHGWRERLMTCAEGQQAFDWGYALLERVAAVTAPRSLVHADLINRNVLVDKGSITGVFDWGSALYGDHLYDLAWLEFWAPWHPELDPVYFRTALERRWHEADYQASHMKQRLLACYLHIGLDHLAYNAYLGRWETLLATALRMGSLAAIISE